MILTTRRLVPGSLLICLTVLGIFILLATNDRLTGPTSQELIDQLVTTNPRSTGDWAEKRPRNWSDAEDERVHRVIARLNADPRRHMDALIANIDRREFATTMSTSVPFSPITVGMICREVIEYHFYRHCPREVIEKPATKDNQINYFDTLTLNHQRLARWWIENRGKSDLEIGRMIADWRSAERAASRRK